MFTPKRNTPVPYRPFRRRGSETGQIQSPLLAVNKKAFLRDTAGQKIPAESQHLCIDTGRIPLYVAKQIVLTAVQAIRSRFSRPP
jgi:hypothetical protein